MQKRWESKRPDPGRVETLAAQLDCDPVIATLFVNRGITSEAEARKFMAAMAADIRPPFVLKGMDRAVRRIYAALNHNENILIFGDYDADGITATAVLFTFLRHAGANVSTHIPHRAREGYGLQPHHITDLARRSKTALVITVDCGSASTDAVETARSAGIDVIITDHHIPPATLPRAAAVINPNRPDCPSGLGALAGVGVAFYLSMALRKYLREKAFWSHRREPNLKALCDLVAIGTIADMVPMRGENRILTRMGLTVVNSDPRSGIRALMDIAGMSGRPAEAGDIAFKMAPRLNAAGRLAHADAAFKLLTATDRSTADALARSLDDLNAQRQSIEKSMTDQALTTLNKDPRLLERCSIVLYDSHWHEGVLGIVASRLVKRYSRPVILITRSNGMGKGSGRSIPGVDLVGALNACSAYLDRFGGHAMAAGLGIAPDRIDDFRDQFDRTIAAATEAGDFMPVLPIDCVLDFKRITGRLLDQMEMLKPYGIGNPEPLFMARNVSVVGSKIVGRSHRQMRLQQSTGRPVNAIQFNVDTGTALPETFERIAFRLQWNRWNGKQSPQIIVDDFVKGNENI